VCVSGFICVCLSGCICLLLSVGFSVCVCVCQCVCVCLSLPACDSGEDKVGYGEQVLPKADMVDSAEA